MTIIVYFCWFPLEKWNTLAQIRLPSGEKSNFVPEQQFCMGDWRLDTCVVVFFMIHWYFCSRRATAYIVSSFHAANMAVQVILDIRFHHLHSFLGEAIMNWDFESSFWRFEKPKMDRPWEGHHLRDFGWYWSKCDSWNGQITLALAPLSLSWRIDN